MAEVWQRQSPRSGPNEQPVESSHLGVSGQRPPYDTVTAIDLATKQIVWQMPMGTVKDTGPFGYAKSRQLPIGLPTLGGPIITSSGLIFMAAAQDKFIRALDVGEVVPPDETVWRLG